MNASDHMEENHLDLPVRWTLPHCGGVLLGFAGMAAIQQASAAHGGLCGPFPPEAFWFRPCLLIPVVWSAVDLARGRREGNALSEWCGGTGVLVAVLSMLLFGSVQNCRN